MELVLHRANTTDRIRHAVAAGIHRLEVDVWYKGGQFRLAHDPTFGLTVVGPNGVTMHERGRGRAAGTGWISRVESYLTLPELLATHPDVPLLVDLKGWWPTAGLRRLAGLLEGRPADLVCAPLARTVDRFRTMSPGVAAAYADRQLTAGRLRSSDGDGRDHRPGVTITEGRLGTAEGTALLERWLRSRLRVYVWQIPDLASLRSLRDRGIAGAIVDDPSWAADGPGPQ